MGATSQEASQRGGEEGRNAIDLKPLRSTARSSTPAEDILPSLPATPHRDSASASLYDGTETGILPEADDDAAPGAGLEAVDGGPGAYRFLAASALFEIVNWGQSYAYGSYESYHQHNPASPLYGRASPAAVTAVGTLLIAGMHFVPLMTRGFFRTYPHYIQRSLIVAVLLTGVTLLVASFLTSSVEALLVFQGILAGLLQGLTFTPIITWLPQWWDKRIGFASGVLLSGSGLGGTIFPIIIGKLLDGVGFEWTLRISAAYTCSAGILAAFLLKPRLPITKPTAKPRNWAKAMAPEGLRSLLHPFALLQIGIILMQAGVWCTISLYLATWTSSLGFSSTASTGVLSSFNAASTVGYLVWGRLIDSVPYLHLMGISSMICSLSCFLLLGFSHSLPLIIIFSLLFGSAGGGFTTFITPISKGIAAMYNYEVAPLYLGVVFIRGFAAVIGPLIGSAMYDRDTETWSLYGTRGFRGIVIYVGVGMLLSGLLAFATRSQQQKLTEAKNLVPGSLRNRAASVAEGRRESVSVGRASLSRGRDAD